jgi:hypothetical protein
MLNPRIGSLASLEGKTASKRLHPLSQSAVDAAGETMMLSRLTFRGGLAAAFGMLSVVFFVACKPSSTLVPIAAIGEAAGGQHATALSLGHIRAALAEVTKRLDASIEDREQFVDEASAALWALVSGDGEAYYRKQIARGVVLDREMAEALAKRWREWGLAACESDSSDRELYLCLWNSRARRLMELPTIDLDRIEAGRGLVALMGTRAWPLSGIRGQRSLLISERGPLTQVEGSSIDGTSRSAHVTLPVVFTGQQHGLLRLNFYFEAETLQWRPVVIAIGSSADEQWPWPMF